MIGSTDWLMFAGAALLMVFTPGPNMIYLISRSICQGQAAGAMSLVGIVLGFMVHATAAAIGLTALFMAVPFAYEVLKWAGALYLLYLAWMSVKPGAASPFEPNQLPHDSTPKLISMGFLTSVLNPKIALFYLSIFPQFISPSNGSVLTQSAILGITQISISFTVNLLIVMTAASLCRWFASNPGWLKAQRYVMGSVLAALAVRMLMEQRKTA